MGFDWIWFLSVWSTGPIGQHISRNNPEWRHEFENTLPDLKEEDIGGSGFAISGYHVHADLGGDEALKRLRERLNARGLKLMLDFVPNHMGPDHPWVSEHPEYFIQGNQSNLEYHPQNFARSKQGKQDMVFAYGRDPYFSGWPDTVQLDYSNPETLEAMAGELLRISSQCDGLRCDMAMLLLPDVFEKTWGRAAHPFWPLAIQAVKKINPDFCFLAEVYWDLEWTLQQQGFDYAYDKRLYDRLVAGAARPVREHLHAGLDYQDKLARFLENHDEPRIAATLDIKNHEAAAVITFLSPGLRFFHQGQIEGKRKRISPHLVRGPQEAVDTYLQEFYSILLGLMKRPVFRDGQWRLLESISAWHGNESWDEFVAFAWRGVDDDRILVVVNYSPQPGQCYLRLPFTDITGAQWRLHDLIGSDTYDRDGNELYSKGLYLDVQPWQYHVFEMNKINT
jgi:glycosidase